MPEKGEVVRRRIVEIANRLIYEKGYNQTSFSDIAEAADIPRGNFYYHFKTKDDILVAVIDRRIASIIAMLDEWDKTIPEPAKRLERFLQMVRNDRRDLSKYGCPMGSLNIELGKAQPELKARAKVMFDLYRDWLEAQFRALGFGKAASGLGLTLLGRAQGIAVIAHVYGDEKLLTRQVDELQGWLNQELARHRTNA